MGYLSPLHCLAKRLNSLAALHWNQCGLSGILLTHLPTLACGFFSCLSLVFGLALYCKLVVGDKKKYTSKNVVILCALYNVIVRLVSIVEWCFWNHVGLLSVRDTWIWWAKVLPFCRSIHKSWFKPSASTWRLWIPHLCFVLLDRGRGMKRGDFRGVTLPRY